MLAEPYSSNQISKVVYLPEDVLEDFLLAGRSKDNEFWVEVAKYYSTMSPSEFEDEKKTYKFYHTSEENFRDTIKGIIGYSRDGEKVKRENAAVYMRVDRILKKIFKGELNPDIKPIAENVTKTEIDEMRKALNSPIQENIPDERTPKDNSNEEK